MRRTCIVFFIVLLLVAVLATPCYAEEAISATYATEVKFPASLTFSLSATSDTNITEVVLNYKIDKITTVTVISEVEPAFNMSPNVHVSWTWDMRTSRLPPGAKVQYRWRIEDAVGKELTTEWQTVRFDDNRYNWNSLSKGQITLHWYKGDASFAQTLLDSGVEALERLSSDTGAHLEEPVEVYIYASASELRGAMVFPQEWTGGFAFVDYGILAIGVAPENLGWGTRAMAHELAHLVTYQMTSNPYGDIPNWLSEGLSMFAEGSLDSTFKAQLDKAIAHDTLFSVQSLSSAFPSDTASATLSYAESYSLIDFLLREYGQEKLLNLLQVFKQGATYDDALRQIYGFDTRGLDDAWRLSLGLQPREPSQTPVPTGRTSLFECQSLSAGAARNDKTWLLLVGLLLLPAVNELNRIRRRNKK
jgi:hypothetical protein